MAPSLVLLVALAPAGPPRVSATASKADVGVGERFTVELVAEGPEGTTWAFPEQAGDDKVELKTVAPAPGQVPPAPGTHRYEAAAFDLRDVSVPKIAVKYRLPDGAEGEVASEEIPLRILSILPKDPKEQKLADIRGPLELGIGRAFWIAAGALLLLAAAAARAIARRRRRGAAPPAPARSEVPPDAEALQALDRLAASGLLAREEYRPFYIELSEIAKRYLERRLAAPVLEMTSAEMVAFLREHLHARAHATTLRDLAGAADQVKFARGSGQAQEAERHIAAVRALIADLEARLRPRPAEAVA